MFKAKGPDVVDATYAVQVPCKILSRQRDCALLAYLLKLNAELAVIIF